MPRKEKRLTLSAVKARAGVTGHHVRVVLAVSTALVIALFAAIYLLNLPLMSFQ